MEREPSYQEPLDIDELMEKIRDEATLRKGTVDPASGQLPNGEGDLPQAKPAKRTSVKKSARLHYKDFIGYDGAEFVNAVFLGLLGREPDPAALSAYQHCLAHGGSKLSILAEVRLSPEGLQRSLALTGMALVLLRHRICRRIGILGRVLNRICTPLDRIFLFFVTPRLSLSDLKAVDDARVQSQQKLVDALQAVMHRQELKIDQLQSRLDTETELKALLGTVNQQLNDRLAESHQQWADALEQSKTEQAARVQDTESGLTQLRQQFNYFQRSHQLSLEALDKVTTNLDLAGAAGEAAEPAGHPVAAKTERSSELANSVKRDKIKREVESQRAALLDAYYVAFEDACRGSRKEIKAGLAHYAPVFKELQRQKTLADKRLVDLGCGRGEWLELVEEWGWQATGIDLNPIMIEVCGEFGLDAQCQDALQYLSSLPDNSLAAITAFHLIEHLPFELLHALVSESMRVIRGGGIILFETPNPENVLVGSHTFYHDFTHRNPITPSSISFLASYFGFTEIEIIRSHPYPESAKVAGSDPLTERVNGHLCGPQDFAILARKPIIDKSGRLANA